MTRNVSGLRLRAIAWLTSLTVVNVLLFPPSAVALLLPTTSHLTPPPALPTPTTFVYDGDGGRVKQTVQDGPTIKTTTYLGESYELASDGTKIKYVFAGSQRIAAVTQSPSTPGTQSLQFYHGDHLGSTNLVTDATGAVVEHTEYRPYGSVSVNTGSVDVAHKFTGQRDDASTGLYFYHARYYAPDLGRFIQADTIVQAPADPQTLNRYTYAGNNPVKYTDPSGHGWFSKFFGSILQILGILGAPFTGGASLWLAFGGTVWSGVQAVQAHQFGAWAAGFAVSAALGFAFQLSSISNFALQVGVNAVKGAAIGAIAGGVGSLVAGGSFGEGAGYGAIGGAAGGAIAGIATSQQYQNLAAGHGFVDNHTYDYRQATQQLRALSLKATDRVNLTEGARPIEGTGAGHEYAAAPNGNRFEMGPRDGSIVTSNTTDVSTWRTSLTTDNAIAAGLARTTTVQVSPYIVDSMALYEAYWSGQPYNAFSYNSNFAVNSVIYGAGGPEKVTGLGLAPGFPDN